MKSPDQREAAFAQAVQLAAAFVANGDIRLGGSTQPDSQALTMLGELIVSLHENISTARRHLGVDT